MKRLRLIKITILLLLFPTLIYSKTTHGNLNTWFQLNTNINITDKFNFFNEIHERTGSFLDDNAQFLIRPSLEYKLEDYLTITLGYTFISNDPFEPYPGDLATIEHNIWEQLFFHFKKDNFIFYNRLRLENRFQDAIEIVDGESIISGTNFINRFRARIGLKYKIDKLYFHIFDEIFINQKDNLTITGLDRNWIYFGVGYNIENDFSLELSIMDQFDKLSPNQINYIESPVMQLTIGKSFDL